MEKARTKTQAVAHACHKIVIYCVTREYFSSNNHPTSWIKWTIYTRKVCFTYTCM